jgi:spermidine synthase
MAYIETDEQLGATIVWNDAQVLHQSVTHRGTRLEFVQRPRWGVTCFMNGVIQSCQADEHIYHRALVDPAIYEPEQGGEYIVAIFGGGEGATAREVLKYPHVTGVDMFEWDSDVIDVFQHTFPQWAQGVWNDSRLSVFIHDAFRVITTISEGVYETVIIDLFEPDEQTGEVWLEFFRHVARILRPRGTVRIYAGMYDHFTNGEAQVYMCTILNRAGFINIRFTRVFVPSFLGEACFIYAEQNRTEGRT